MRAALPALLAWSVGAVVLEQGPDLRAGAREGQSPISDRPCTEEDVAGKDLDLVVYGATGISGRHAAYYLASLPQEPRWAIAGRSKANLTTTMARVGRKVEIIEAGLQEDDRLRRMAGRARAVLSFAGPFEQYGGEGLIRAALQGCAHYIDVSTEPRWKLRMMQKYALKASQRRVAIVQGAGFEAMMSDLLALSAALDYNATQGAPPSTASVTWRVLNGGYQGGPYWSHVDAMRKGFVRDPYSLSPGVVPEMRVDQTVDGHTEDSLANQPLEEERLARFEPAGRTCPVVRLSMAMTFPSHPVAVREAAVASLAQARQVFLQSHVGGDYWESVEPGEGPPLWVRTEGSFVGDAVAAGADREGYSRVTMGGQGDPSNVGTAKMAAELALGLVFEGTATGGGGYFTPATAIGPRGLERRLSQAEQGRFMSFGHSQDAAY